jgi:hypothetical protein
MDYIPVVILGGIGGIVLIGYAYSLIDPKKNQTNNFSNNGFSNNLDEGDQPNSGGSKCKKFKKNKKSKKNKKIKE